MCTHRGKRLRYENSLSRDLTTRSPLQRHLSDSTAPFHQLPFLTGQGPTSARLFNDDGLPAALRLGISALLDTFVDYPPSQAPPRRRVLRRPPAGKAHGVGLSHDEILEGLMNLRLLAAVCVLSLAVAAVPVGARAFGVAECSAPLTRIIS